MAEQAAKALTELAYCNLHGLPVDTDALLQYAEDYIGAEDSDETDDGESDIDDDVNDALDRLDLPETANYATVVQELGLHDDAAEDKANADEDDGHGVVEDDDGVDGPTVVVDPVKDIMDAVGDMLISGCKEKEQTMIANFKCSSRCKLFAAGKCYKQFSAEYVESLRMQMMALMSNEKEMFIMGKISCMINLSEETACSKRAHQKERSRKRTTFMVDNKVICRDTFRFMHCIGNTRLTKIINAYAAGNVAPIEKDCGGRRNANIALTFEDIKRVANFLTIFAETHAMVLPGRVPGFKRDDIKLLPSHETKCSVWRHYTTAMEGSGHRAAKLSSFKSIWARLLPHIVRTKPMSDLCWACQKNNAEVYRSANLPDIVKQAKLKKQLGHLELVTKERSLYREMVQDSKAVIGDLKLGPNEPCSRDVASHYSFDFAQQVHIPSNPLQPGPIYFLVPRKCGIFGVACEAVPQQVNYLIDEGMCSSKGSNAVISYLHHFFGNYGLGETDLHLHCDNCSGQNKNKFLVWYFLWRTMHGLHRTVTVNFMIAGHTKFAPDQCFGLLKQSYRRTEVSSLEELATCVTRSSPVAGVNIPQLVGDEAGNISVPLFDWQAYLSPFFKPLDGIKKLQHLRFDGQHAGSVFGKETTDGEERTVQLLKNIAEQPPAALPENVLPPGLDHKRQWYLFTKIREFCSEGTRDTVCPRPVGPYVEVEDLDEEVQEPPAKKKKAAETRKKAVKKAPTKRQ